jgi:hypothetical protein
VTFGNQATDLQISAVSSALTLQGTCSSTSMVMFRAQLDATATTFSPMADFRLLGWKINWTLQ